MAADAAWAPVGPERYGITLDRPAAAHATSLDAIASPSHAGAREQKLLSVDNPFTVWAAAAALTFGLMAFSTSVRVGHTTASVAIGSTK